MAKVLSAQAVRLMALASNGPLKALELKSEVRSRKSLLCERLWEWYLNYSFIIRTASGNLELSKTLLKIGLISGSTTVTTLISGS